MRAIRTSSIAHAEPARFPRSGTRWAGLAIIALACLLSACSSTPTRSLTSRDASGQRTHGAAINDPSAGLEEISIEAMALVGTPYRYGGNTPDSGFDCSGLVRYVVQRAASVNLPRTAAEMGTRGFALERRDVASGDLVFFNTTGRPNSHVGIYVGQNRFVHAPATGGTVRLEDMSKRYWASRYMGARRVVAVSNLPDLPASPLPPRKASPPVRPHPPPRQPTRTTTTRLAHWRAPAARNPRP